jgi:hypothetical protein
MRLRKAQRSCTVLFILKLLIGSGYRSDTGNPCYRYKAATDNVTSSLQELQSYAAIMCGISCSTNEGEPFGRLSTGIFDDALIAT